jgi:hypothetical protein
VLTDETPDFVRGFTCCSHARQPKEDRQGIAADGADIAALNASDQWIDRDAVIIARPCARRTVLTGTRPRSAARA